MTNTNTPPEWAIEIAKAFNQLYRNQSKAIDDAVSQWVAWERKHLHDKPQPAIPVALRLGYACAVMVGTLNRVTEELSPDLVLLACLEAISLPDVKQHGLLPGTCIAAVSPLNWQKWQTQEGRLKDAWEMVNKAFEVARDTEEIERPRMSEQTIEELKKLAHSTEEDAVNKFLAAFPYLSKEEFQAGILHYQDRLTWVEMATRLECSKATLKKLIDRFYEETGLTRTNRKRGFGGKKYSLDENRDSPKHIQEYETN